METQSPQKIPKDLELHLTKISSNAVATYLKVFGLIILMLLVLTFSLFMYTKITPENKLPNIPNVDKDLTYPTYPTSNLLGIGSGVILDWEMKSIQSYVKEIVIDGESTFLELSADDKIFKAYLSGTVADESLIGVYVASGDSSELLPVTQVVRDIKVGDQIGVRYLSKYPDKDLRTTESCTSLVRFCQIANLTDYYKEQGLLFTPESVLTDNKVLPVLEVYKELVNE